ncbi:MAG: PAS domain S-box protein, partial [Candidatus Zixiibacteriota bacterium]
MSSNLKILVADDNRDHVQLITEILNQELKAEVESVTTGEECLKEVEKESYDLLLLDYLLPKINGLDILKNIVKKGYDLPVIMITGHGNEKIAAEAMKSGAIDYIVKSADGFEALPSLAKKAIEKSLLKRRVRESEEEFKNLFESANDAIIHLDRSGRILEVNKKAMEVFGGTKAEVLGKHFKELGIFSLDEIPTLVRNFANILADKEISLTLSIRNKKGVEVPLECSASLIKTDGKTTGIMVIARDITERKEAEKKIRKEKEFTLSLLKGLKEGFAVVDQEGKQILVNDELCKMTGYSEKELLNQKPPFKYWAEEGLKDIKEAFEKTLEGIEGEYELIFNRKDGERFIALVSPRKTTDPDGNTIFFATVKDITERKRA